MRLPLLAACAVAFFVETASPAACAQGSRTDYERAANFRRTTANTVFRDRIEPHWLPGNTRFWYEVSTGPGTREYVLVDTEKGERKLAFDHARLARALKEAGASDAQANKLTLRDLEWTGDTLSFSTARKRWRVELKNYEVLEQKEIEAKSATGFAPADGPTRSRRTGPHTPLRFNNRTKQEVEMFWLDPEGKRVSYGRVAPGESAEQGTYAGHVWLLVDVPTSRPLVVYEAVENQHVFDITGPVASKSKGGLAPADGPKRTSRDGPQSPLIFNNRTKQEVEMFWLNHEGTRVSYGRVAPGE
jgi:dipeptidyl-peptidase 4